MLPTTRLVGAGATPAELEQLQAEHDAASPKARDSQLDMLRGISEGGIREWLDSLRAAGHLGDTPVEEPVDAGPANPAHDPHAVATLAAQLQGKPAPRRPRAPKA